MTSNRARLFFVVASAGALFLLTALKGPGLLPGGDPVLKPLAIFTEVLKLTRDNYVEPVDVSDLLAGAYDGVTDAIDPYSFYVPGDKMARFRSFEASHAVSVGLALGRRSGFAYVVSPALGGPADQAGIEADDVILSVDGDTTRNLALWEVEAKLVGAEGSHVTLKIIRAGDEHEREISIERRPFTLAPVAPRDVDGVRVLRVPGFGAGTAKAIAADLRAGTATGRLVIDVRNCASGDVEEAVRAASLFIPPGTVAKLSGHRTPEKTLVTDGEQIWKAKPLVLVDGGTAGAAEVFAGALADRGGADLVGEPTAGMAVVQKLIPTASGGALYMTVAAYSSPSGTELAGKGLKPTVRVDVFPADETDKKDPILARALDLARHPA